MISAGAKCCGSATGGQPPSRHRAVHGCAVSARQQKRPRRFLSSHESQVRGSQGDHSRRPETRPDPLPPDHHRPGIRRQSFRRRSGCAIRSARRSNYAPKPKPRISNWFLSNRPGAFFKSEARTPVGVRSDCVTRHAARRPKAEGFFRCKREGSASRMRP